MPELPGKSGAGVSFMRSHTPAGEWCERMRIGERNSWPNSVVIAHCD
jgi:hypothetical protein